MDKSDPLSFILGCLVTAAVFLLWPREKEQDIYTIPPTAFDIRQELGKICQSNGQLHVEIENLLPTNSEGLITASILRKVLHDVVENCK